MNVTYIVNMIEFAMMVSTVWVIAVTGITWGLARACWIVNKLLILTANIWDKNIPETKYI